jgi:cell division protein FtsB
MDFQSILKSRLFTFPALILLAISLILGYQLYVQKKDVYREIEKLNQQAEKIKADNTKLSSLINYYSTPEFLEKEAREKLNLKKEGEVVVALPKLEDTDNTISKESKSNFKQWFDYFFTKNNEE